MLAGRKSKVLTVDLHRHFSYCTLRRIEINQCFMRLVETFAFLIPNMLFHSYE